MSVAGPLGVTHMMVVSQSDRHTNLRVARLPKGPTLTFRVHEYALIRDVLASQMKPRSPGQEFQQAPLVRT